MCLVAFTQHLHANMEGVGFQVLEQFEGNQGFDDLNSVLDEVGFAVAVVRVFGTKGPTQVTRVVFVDNELPQKPGPLLEECKFNGIFEDFFIDTGLFTWVVFKLREKSTRTLDFLGNVVPNNGKSSRKPELVPEIDHGFVVVTRNHDTEHSTPEIRYCRLDR